MGYPICYRVPTFKFVRLKFHSFGINYIFAILINISIHNIFMKKNKTPITEENDLMTVADFAKKMGVTKDSVYKRLNTPETPNGDIYPEVDENNQWRVRYSTNKDVTFKSITKRTKVSVAR